VRISIFTNDPGAIDRSDWAIPSRLYSPLTCLIM